MIKIELDAEIVAVGSSRKDGLPAADLSFMPSGKYRSLPLSGDQAAILANHVYKHVKIIIEVTE